MPRRGRKSSLLKSKPQLLFREPPLDGATHCCGPQVRSAVNPRSFLSEQQRPSTSGLSSWVTPQFDPSMQLERPARRGGRGMRKGRMSRTVLDGSSLLSLPPLRKTSVCKFPCLKFERHIASNPHPPASTHGERTQNPLTGAPQDKEGSNPFHRGVSPKSKGTGGIETPKQVSSLEKMGTEDTVVCRVTPTTPAAHTAGENQGLDCTIITPARHNPPAADSGFTPPDINTPEIQGNGDAAGDTCLSSLRLLFPLTPLGTPLQALPPAVLVSDTPEQDYGLRANWRRGRRFVKD